MKIQLGRKLDGTLEQYIEQWFTTGNLQSLFLQYGVDTTSCNETLCYSNLIPNPKVFSPEILVRSVGGTSWLLLPVSVANTFHFLFIWLWTTHRSFTHSLIDKSCQFQFVSVVLQ